MISELIQGGVRCPEPVRDVKALLPTSRRRAVSFRPSFRWLLSPSLRSIPKGEVTDEPPRE